MRDPRLVLFKAARLLVEALDGLCIFMMVVVLGPPVLMRFNPGTSIGVIAPVSRRLAYFEAPLTAFLHAHLSFQFGGMDPAPFLIAFLLLLCSVGFAALSKRLRVEILTLKELEKVAEAEEAAARADVAGRLAALSAGAPSEREQVLKVYAQAKKILEGQKRTVAFLAADVVDAQSMKRGEEPAIAERDFRRYRELVEGILERRGALKTAWTPDGVMICFASLEDAVGAGQDLIRVLPDFNRSVKSMKADFAVRCGVNSGEVLYDEATPMEQMSDKSIDLTGHLQKYAPPGTIYAARGVLGERGAALGFAPVDKTVDGLDVSAWTAG